MEVEEKLKSIWYELLSKKGEAPEEIQRDSNFFEIGGTSLFIGIMTIMIEKEFGVKIGPDIFYDDPTLGGIAEEIVSLSMEEKGA